MRERYNRAVSVRRGIRRENKRLAIAFQQLSDGFDDSGAGRGFGYMVRFFF